MAASIFIGNLVSIGRAISIIVAAGRVSPNFISMPASPTASYCSTSFSALPVAKGGLNTLKDEPGPTKLPKQATAVIPEIWAVFPIRAARAWPSASTTKRR